MSAATYQRRPNNPFGFDWDLDEIIAKNSKILEDEKNRGKPLRREKEQLVHVDKIDTTDITEDDVDMPLTPKETQPLYESNVPMKPVIMNENTKLDLQYIFDMNLRSQPYWPTNDPCHCDNCRAFIEQSGGVVLVNCQKHKLCKVCVFKQLNLPDSLRTCPVIGCRASMKKSELTSLEKELEEWKAREKFGDVERSSVNETLPERTSSPKMSSKTSIHITYSGARPKINESMIAPSEFRFGMSPTKSFQGSVTSSPVSYGNLRNEPANSRILSTSIFESSQKTGRCEDLELDMSYVRRLGMANDKYWTTNERCSCDCCGKSIEERSGIVFKNCCKHNVCRMCAFKEITEKAMQSRCPVNNCGALITYEELESIRHEESTKPTLRQNDELDLTYLDTMQLRDNDFWPTSGVKKCIKCNGFIKKMDGLVLKNCRKHSLCKPCVFAKLQEIMPSCPVVHCIARIERNELDALRSMQREVKKQELQDQQNTIVQQQSTTKSDRNEYPKLARKCRQCKNTTEGETPLCDDCRIGESKGWKTVPVRKNKADGNDTKKKFSWKSPF